MAGEELPAAPVAAAPEPVAAAPVAATPAPVAPTPVSETAPPALAAAEPAAPVKEFAPSLLDEALAKPAEPAKPEPAKEPKPAEPVAAEPAKEPTQAKPAEPVKPAEPAKPAEPLPPIEYAFTRADDKGERVPIGADQIDPERLGLFTGVLQESRVPPAAAQKMLDLHLDELNRAISARDQRQWDVFAETQRVWRDEVMAHPELGGSRHGTAIKTVMGLIDAYSQRPGPDGKGRPAEEVAAERQKLMDVARVTGIANNPTWLHLLHWAGDKYVREPGPRAAPPPRTPNPTKEQRGLGRYKNTTPHANGPG